MDLNRLKKNITSRNWSSKSKQTNINYIKGKLKQFGLSIPKYLAQGKLTDKQVQAQSKRILKSIENQIDIQREQANVPSYDKAMKQLEKAVKKHNQLVYKKLNYVIKKHNLTENQLNYLIGRDVTVDGYKINNKFVIRRQNTQFGIIDLENFYADGIDTIKSRIKQINKFNDRLSNNVIDKEIDNDYTVLNAVENLLSAYVSDGHMEAHVKNQIMEQLKMMNGMQQKAFYNMLMATAPKSKYIIREDELEDLQLNLYNKWSMLLQQARRF